MSRLTSERFEITELAHHGPEDLFISVVTLTGAFCVMLTIRWELLSSSLPWCRSSSSSRCGSANG